MPMQYLTEKTYRFQGTWKFLHDSADESINEDTCGHDQSTSQHEEFLLSVLNKAYLKVYKVILAILSDIYTLHCRSAQN